MRNSFNIFGFEGHTEVFSVRILLRASRLLFKYSFISNPYRISTNSIRKKLMAYSLNLYNLGVPVGRQ